MQRSWIPLATTGLAAVLLQGALLSQGSPSFSFEDATHAVRMRTLPSSTHSARHLTGVFDDHFLGACFVDIDNSGHPDLILPAQHGFPMLSSYQEASYAYGAEQAGGFDIYLWDEASAGFLLLEPLPQQQQHISFWSKEHALNAGLTTLRDTFLDGNDDWVGARVEGIVAFDYDNDGDLDLLLVCADEPCDPDGNPEDWGGSLTLWDMEYSMHYPPPRCAWNRLLKNLLVETGSLGFEDVTEATDPDPDTALDGHGLAYTEEPSGLLADASGSAWEHDPSRTTFSHSSGIATVADVNRDGWLDVFIMPHSNLTTVQKPDWRIGGMMGALYLNLGPVGPDGEHCFWDVTYDRTLYPAAFSSDPKWGTWSPPANLVKRSRWYPVWGYQGSEMSHYHGQAGNHRHNYLSPNPDPFWRFSSSNACAFTDLNNDGWPDLIVTNKAREEISPFTRPGTLGVLDDLGWSYLQSLWLDGEMV